MVRFSLMWGGCKIFEGGLNKTIFSNVTLPFPCQGKCSKSDLRWKNVCQKAAIRVNHADNILENQPFCRPENYASANAVSPVTLSYYCIWLRTYLATPIVQTFQQTGRIGSSQSTVDQSIIEMRWSSTQPRRFNRMAVVLAKFMQSCN